MSKNSYLNMAASILDTMNFEKIYKALPLLKRIKFVKNAQIILAKCYKSAEKVGLSTEKAVYEEYLTTVTRLLDAKTLLPSYKKFSKLTNIK